MNRFAIRWRNFRGFEDSGWIDIRPITILIGPNNSGKSSVLAPLLLLKQTLRSQNPELALQARGELINAGGYRDLVTNHQTDLKIGFDLRWARDEDTPRPPPVPSSPPGAVRLSFGLQDEEIVLATYHIYDEYGRRLATRRRRASGGYSLEGFPIKRDPSITRRLKRRDTTVLGAPPNHFIFRGSDAVSELVGDDRPIRARGTLLSDFGALFVAMMTWTENEIDALLQNVSYLGPIREPLRRVYEISGDPPRDVGTRGQFAPEILFRHPDLLDETREWLTRFGFGRSVQPKTAREAAFSIVLTGRPAVNAADAGFGASQVLPLIVQGLFGPEESVLLAEQPEIHLNPRLQTEVADFFCHLASTGRGVIAETHSEHLLLRLRTLVAKHLLSEDDVALYFVERGSRGRSTIRPIPMTEDGRIRTEEWPSGFFQESVREALALASAQAKS